MPTTKDTRGGRKAHEVVADLIRGQIVSGELAQGQRLAPEDELTVEHGVARTTLREALRVLESQGLIAIRRGRGGGPVVTHPDLEPISMALATVLQLRATTVGDLDAARQLIETQIAGQLARNHDTVDLSALSTAIDVASESAERGDGIAFGLAAVNVHETLVSSSGNNTLGTLTKLMQGMLRDYYTRQMDVVDPELMRRAVRSYRKLLRLINEGNEDAATAHWQATMQYTLAARDPGERVTISAGS
jgi:GntR family transcriptional regulator, transcriptional repressor for pyruvate dehydrogenase complex